MGYVPILALLLVLGLQPHPILWGLLLEVCGAVVGGITILGLQHRRWGSGGTQVWVCGVFVLWWSGVGVVGLDGYRVEYCCGQGGVACGYQIQGYQVYDCRNVAS